jgi:hypothetical protein
VIAVIQAIYDDPKAKIAGTSQWFRAARGVQQGCVLGPIMFTILLEFCLRLAKLEDIGISMRCIGRAGLPLPTDLQEVQFRISYGGFADDIVLFGVDEEHLQLALESIQEVTSRIGLDVSPEKTKWVYLNQPKVGGADSGCDRGKGKDKGLCCHKIQLHGTPIRHANEFNYLGSMVEEESPGTCK